MEAVRSLAEDIRAEYRKVVVGQSEVIDHLILALLVQGHVLLEGVPGVAKTVLVRTLSAVLGVGFKRIQFTPDMMPSDILGTSVFDLATNRFNLRRGPIFTNLLLADEINRTPPKTQAALLEVMEERQVTIDGEGYSLPAPFMVCATLNPVEYEGTYPLPEAQLDRFLFKLLVGYPEPEAEAELFRRVDQGFDSRRLEDLGVQPVATAERLAAAGCWREVSCAEEVLEYLGRVVRATRDSLDILLGASPRAGMALLQASKVHAAMAGRDYVTPDDLKALCPAVLRHRLVLRPETEIEGRRPDEVIADVLDEVEVPR